jgi:hypothetical protein
MSIKDFRGRYPKEEVRYQKPEVEALKMHFVEDELANFILAIQIPMLIGSIILYILVTCPLPYERP